MLRQGRTFTHRHSRHGAQHVKLLSIKGSFRPPSYSSGAVSLIGEVEPSVKRLSNNTASGESSVDSGQIRDLSSMIPTGA
jgi:hypothetical protein